MKRTITIIAIAAMPFLARAEISTATTNYFTNATFVATGEAWTNGFSGNAIVFDVAELNELTDAESSNDVRAVVFNILLHLYDEIQAIDSTNRPAYFTIQQSIRNSTTSDFVVNHDISTHQNIGTITIPSE